jgi:hypothetical protein
MSRTASKKRQPITSTPQWFKGDIFPQIKVIKTRRNVECFICDGIIAKGSKVMVVYGVDDYGTNHFDRFHVDNEFACYITFADRLDPEEDENDKAFVLETAAFLNRREWK